VPVEIGQKTYYTVAERIRLANGEEAATPVGITSVITEVKEVGHVMVVCATVTFKDGRIYTGHAMVNTDSRQRVEASAPLETAETSALGRALAFAGYFGSPDGIAGYEELMSAQDRESQRGQSGQRVIQSQPTTFFADETSPVTRVPSVVGSGAAPRPVGGSIGGGPGGVAGGASPAQVRYATKLWGDAGRPLPPPNFATMNGTMISTLIDELKAEAAR
jgi:hypothetical protein